MENKAKAKRPISEIALEITREWKRPVIAARPYLNAMLSLGKITDLYDCDDGRTIVLYFLNNSVAFRGDVARRCKAELKEHLKG